MIGLVYSVKDVTAREAAQHLINEYGFALKGEVLTEGDVSLHEVDDSLNADSVDSLGLDVACFLSKHESVAKIASLTVHAEGNWNDRADAGGRPGKLSVAAPVEMRSVLSSFYSHEIADIKKTYEATHHGPLLNTPSFFAEIGGGRVSRGEAQAYAEAVYEAIIDAKDGKISYEKIAIGIGGGHYPMPFTKLAVDKGYAFAHIMPTYAFLNADGTDNFGMVEEAVRKSGVEPDVAVLDKRIDTGSRTTIIEKLKESGIECEEV